jgi:TonB family protein
LIEREERAHHMWRITEHDRRMRRRLMLITPLVVLAHALAFVALSRVDLVRSTITLGYQGPPKFEPEISIIDDRTPEATVLSRERRALVVENVFIEGEDRPRRATGTRPVHKPGERTVEPKVAVPAPGEETFRTYPSHAAVPYRQDYVILRMVTPEYPPDAIANAEEGWVLVEAYIDASGRVDEAYVRSSYGPRSFEASSLAAVRQFLFKSVREGGRPVSFWVSFLVRFQLRR